MARKKAVQKGTIVKKVNGIEVKKTKGGSFFIRSNAKDKWKRVTKNQGTSYFAKGGDVKTLEKISKALAKGSKIHKKQSEQLEGASELHKSQSKQLDRIAEDLETRNRIDSAIKGGANYSSLKKLEALAKKNKKMAKGGKIENWMNATEGDSALVISENRMGLIVKAYGRKFHLKFPNGEDKTYDKNDLEFYGQSSSYDKGGKIEKYEVYIDFMNKDKNFATDRKYFKTYQDAEKWAKKEFDKFNPDMIGYTESFAKGGITEGESHAEGGIPMEVSSTGQKVELEGGEGVINKKNMADTKKHEFEGKMLTKCEIASEINSDGGNGVDIDCDGITGKKYKHEDGGKVGERRSRYETDIAKENYYGTKPESDYTDPTNWDKERYLGMTSIPTIDNRVGNSDYLTTSMKDDKFLNDAFGRGGKIENVKRFLNKFPSDATSWVDATDEIRDLSRVSKEYVNEYDLDVLDDNPKAVKPLDFRKLKKPSQWNTEGKKYILKNIDKMTDRTFEIFYNYYRNWFDKSYEGGGAVKNEKETFILEITNHSLNEYDDYELNNFSVAKLKYVLDDLNEDAIARQKNRFDELQNRIEPPDFEDGGIINRDDPNYEFKVVDSGEITKDDIREVKQRLFRPSDDVIYQDESQIDYMGMEMLEEGGMVKPSEVLRDYDSKCSRKSRMKKMRMGGMTSSSLTDVEFNRDVEIDVFSQEGDFKYSWEAEDGVMYGFHFLYIDKSDNEVHFMMDGSSDVFSVKRNVIDIEGYDFELGGEVGKIPYSKYDDKLSEQDKDILDLLRRNSNIDNLDVDKQEFISNFKGDNIANKIDTNIIEKLFGLVYEHKPSQFSLNDLLITNGGIGKIANQRPEDIKVGVLNNSYKFSKIEQKISESINKSADKLHYFDLMYAYKFMSIINVHKEKNPAFLLQGYGRVSSYAHTMCVIVDLSTFDTMDKLEKYKGHINRNYVEQGKASVIFAKVNEGLTDDTNFALFTILKYGY